MGGRKRGADSLELQPEATAVAPARKGTKRRRRVQQYLDYVCCTPATLLAVHSQRSVDSKVAFHLESGEHVRVKKIVQEGGREWAHVVRSDHVSAGWALTKVPRSKLLRPQKPSFAIVGSLSCYAVEPTRQWMRREAFSELPEGLLEQTLPSTLLRAVVRRYNPPEAPPLSIVIGTRSGRLVTIVYALTSTTERGRGLMRLLVSTFLSELCRSDDEVVVLCVKSDVAVWHALGFVHSPRDPKETGLIPIADAHSLCLRWPAGKPYPDPDPIWEAAQDFRRWY
eukprot:TRINITY_DN14882_c0_g1_i1.p1 TRINITY_DN14882_c0_g1~~TRINITY_DN14882_c0_g1_i1.p1  ORF type:complete len:282 (+),score=31.96 TRINITY_DN14882_c0_g1_i1:91-936(+)